VKAHNNAAIKGHLIRGAFYLLLLSAGTSLAFFRHEIAAKVSHRTLTFGERVTYQQAIEEVYWRHRIWPKERPDPKPSLDAVISRAQLEEKVRDYLQSSQALADEWQRPITAEQLQAEMDRIAQHTKQPEVLRELFAALGNDSFVIAECLARPLLAERLLADSASELVKQTSHTYEQVVPAIDDYRLPSISNEGECTDDTWVVTSTINVPAARNAHTAVWTGSEMIVWGGTGASGYDNTGGRYNPSTDSWAPTSTTNAPVARAEHTAVWTGSEMIVWGGDSNLGYFETGGRYNPSTDSWTATSTTNAPVARGGHTAVWTGNEMIIWGGDYYDGSDHFLNTGGRYNPDTDSWTPTRIINAPTARADQTAVWTGSEMIVWGGIDDLPPSGLSHIGGRYNPSTDSWTATSTINAPSDRYVHTAVWTGGEMIVWGGTDFLNVFKTGGRYNPSTNTWAPTRIINAPDARLLHTAVWTDSEMIVWGGTGRGGFRNTGGRYSPGTNSWTVTSTINAPSARQSHTAVWAGSQMVVWGEMMARPFPTPARDTARKLLWCRSFATSPRAPLCRQAIT
jgi:N-acetylneuraminic acid mutarotase